MSGRKADDTCSGGGGRDVCLQAWAMAGRRHAVYFQTIAGSRCCVLREWCCVEEEKGGVRNGLVEKRYEREMGKGRERRRGKKDDRKGKVRGKGRGMYS